MSTDDNFTDSDKVLFAEIKATDARARLEATQFLRHEKHRSR